MKKFTRDYRLHYSPPEPFGDYYRGMKLCVLDIETTGLSTETAKVCLIALLTETESGVRITQFLAEDWYEEDRVLRAAMDHIRDERIDYLITYNGQSFDVPFINRRMNALFMDDYLRMYNFDLYRYVKSCTDLRERAGTLRQKSLEAYYGILGDRQDEISGRESAALFSEYAASGNPVIEKIILTHNREDVLQLLRLVMLSVGECSDVHKAAAGYGFPALGGRMSVRPALNRSRKLLRVSGEQFRDPLSADYYPDPHSPVSVHFNAASSSYEIEIPYAVHGDGMFIDADACGIGNDSRIREDSEYVNGFLILGPRTVNAAALAAAEAAVLRINGGGY